ncbi:cyclopropane fatty-acyl-phospholipid synthase-like methyltransferase [Bacillus niacini]|uniref:Cyclopropane fatty-acyl-phospholipid synthase-like methyltransferase n=2 Tax=Neobacillus TaxID=2675232 RepID=A0A852TAW5_9BACI|nr:cyclopropane fatty-acyl-phospholipid synthase-like methyltransferase [Neobacillus niacini]
MKRWLVSSGTKECYDVGCGHGEFMIQCAKYAKEIVGFTVLIAAKY